jgi:hypothetical protein
MEVAIGINEEESYYNGLLSIFDVLFDILGF